MSLKLGETAPNFQADTTEGQIDFHEWIGNDWVIFFSHPADFTPVCTTELGETANLKEAFAERNAKAIAISVDSVEEHKKWAKDIADFAGREVNFPIIGDTDHKVSELYDMIHPGEGDTSSVRTVFIIDPNKKVRLTLTYPKSAGRNFNEIVRALDAIQLTEKHSISTPVNWEAGDEVVISPKLSEEEIKAQFPDGHKEIKPYLRLGKLPN